MIVRIALAACILLTSTPAFSHSGGLDSSGGHRNSKTGGYHYHSRVGHSSGSSHYAPSIGIFRPPSSQPSTLPGEKTTDDKPARESARSDARSTPREAARTEPKPPKRVDHFHFHHTQNDPFAVESFEDDGQFWSVMLVKGWKVKLRKDKIVRIEAVDDPKSYRTWYDQPGTHSVVAKFDYYTAPTVYLRAFGHNRPIALDAHILSNADQLHLYYEILHPTQERAEEHVQ